MSTSTIERRGRDLTRLPDEVRARLAEHRLDLLEAGVAARQGGDLLEVRRAPLELREDEDGNPILDGYATTYGYPYDVAGGPPWGWTEEFVDGSCAKSVRERDDVRFLFDHEGLVMARTKVRTLELESDEHGLRVEARPNPDMRFAQDVVSSIRRGDVDEMSLAFRAIRQEWNDDYTHRKIIEAKLFDVSAVSFPANPSTVIQARSSDPSTSSPGDGSSSESGGLSLVLARAQAHRALSR